MKKVLLTLLCLWCLSSLSAGTMHMTLTDFPQTSSTSTQNINFTVDDSEDTYSVSVDFETIRYYTNGSYLMIYQNGEISFDLPDNVIPTKVSFTTSSGTAAANVVWQIKQEDGTLVNVLDKTIGKKKTYSADVPETLQIAGANNVISALNKNAQITDLSIEFTVADAPAPAVAAPVITPATGEYTEAPQTVSITCDTEGALIYYTLDGSDPSNESYAYEGEFEIEETTTVKAIAYVGEESSKIATSVITINIPFAADWEHTFTSSTFNKNGTAVTISEKSWSALYEPVSGYEAYLKFDSGKGVQLGSSKNPAKSVQIKSNDFPGLKIKGVDVKVACASKVTTGTVSVSVNGVAYGEAQALTTSTTEYTFTGDEMGEIVITLSNPNEEAGAMYISYIGLQYEADERANPDLAFDEDILEVALNVESLTAEKLPVLSGAEGFDLSQLTFTSSDENVVVIEEYGSEALFIAEGTAVISVSFAGDKTWHPASASYTVKVTAPVYEEIANFPYEEPFAGSFGSFKAVDGEGSTVKNVWTLASYNGDKYAKASGYVNKTNNAAEGWLISPLLVLPADSPMTLSFSEVVNSYFGNAADEAEVLITTDKGANWTKLNIVHPTPTSGYSAWTDQNISLADYAGQSARVAFHYTSTTSAAGTWEVRSVKVEAAATGIADVNAESETPAAYYNLQGNRVDGNAKGIIIRVDANGSVKLMR